VSESLNLVYRTIDEQHADKPLATRRQIVGGMAATLGTLGLLGAAERADAAPRAASHRTDPEQLLAVAATAEVLATIVNTVGAEVLEEEINNLHTLFLANVRAAAREELIHFQVLTGALGARPVTTRIYVPDVVFSSPRAFFTTLEIGDQVFINAYLLATTVFGNRGMGREARFAAEFMGAEAVHRAVARNALGKLANDRVFMRYSQPEEADVETRGTPGFRTPLAHVAFLASLGFGFGEVGQVNGQPVPGRFYEFAEVSARTPDLPEVNTRTPR